jgi:hypothetical protein
MLPDLEPLAPFPTMRACVGEREMMHLDACSAVLHLGDETLIIGAEYDILDATTRKCLERHRLQRAGDALSLRRNPEAQA